MPLRQIVFDRYLWYFAIQIDIQPAYTSYNCIDKHFTGFVGLSSNFVFRNIIHMFTVFKEEGTYTIWHGLFLYPPSIFLSPTSATKRDAYITTTRPHVWFSYSSRLKNCDCRRPRFAPNHNGFLWKTLFQAYIIVLFVNV